MVPLTKRVDGGKRHTFHKVIRINRRTTCAGKSIRTVVLVVARNIADGVIGSTTESHKKDGGTSNSATGLHYRVKAKDMQGSRTQGRCQYCQHRALPRSKMRVLQPSEKEKNVFRYHMTVPAKQMRTHPLETHGTQQRVFQFTVVMLR